MNGMQVQTSSATLVGLVAGFAAGQHWLGLDVNAWTAVIGAGLVLWPAVVTRLQSLKNTVGKSGALVVTAADSANALPNNPNVVAPTQVTSAILTTAK